MTTNNERDTSNVLKKNIAAQYLLQLAIYVFPFITLPYLTRVLGPDEFAVRAYAGSVMAIVTTLVSYGFNMYGTREVARNRTNLPFLIRLSSTIFSLRLIMAIAGGIIVLGISYVIPIMRENQLYMIIAYFGFCLTGMLPDYIFQGLEDMSILTKRFVVSRLVSLILIFAFVRSSDQLILVACFEAVPSIIAFAWSWIDVIYKRKIALRFSTIQKAYLWEVLKVATVFFLSSAATTIFTSFTTIMIGIYITNAAEISYWTLALTVITAVQSLYSPIVKSTYPHMVANRNFALIKKFLVLGTPLALLATIASIVFANPIMFLLGGSEYLSGSYVLQLVSPILLLSYPAMLVGFPVLAVIDKEKQLTISSVISAVFQIIGLIILATCGVFTITTVAILRCCTELILLVVRAFFVIKDRDLLSKVPTL